MQHQKKRIAILGSTGSIGKQALEVIASYPENFQVELLVANQNADVLIEQALKYKPDTVVIGKKELYDKVNDALSPEDIKVFAGKDSIVQTLEIKSPDLVITAMVGFAGLEPTIAAINSGADIALANKETLVVAGDIIMKLAKIKGVKIIPVDSEHSAIFQCLQGEHQNKIEKIYLTASGGPFRGKDLVYLEKVTKEHALKHPNWNMGAKITVDSATLMNKGLEMIEARWLFDLTPGQVEVIVHPQSILHSIVQFEDGSMKAQMGLPDMKLPILYALSFPHRLKSAFPRFSFNDFQQLTFELPDEKTFSALNLARKAMHKGGNLPCILNAANETAVAAFLADEISFLMIPEIVESCMEQIKFTSQPSFNDYLETHIETQRIAHELIAQKKSINSHSQ